jgi:hypothetical protein
LHQLASRDLGHFLAILESVSDLDAVAYLEPMLPQDVPTEGLRWRRPGQDIDQWKGQLVSRLDTSN